MAASLHPDMLDAHTLTYRRDRQPGQREPNSADRLYYEFARGESDTDTDPTVSPCFHAPLFTQLFPLDAPPKLYSRTPCFANRQQSPVPERRDAAQTRQK
jgi:hypothetical protein